MGSSMRLHCYVSVAPLSVTSLSFLPFWNEKENQSPDQL